MINYAAYLKDFLQWCEYTEEAVDSLLSDYAKLHADEEIGRRFDTLVDLYDRDLLFNYQGALELVKGYAEAAGVPWQAGHLLFALCLSRHAKDRYKEKNIPDEVYRMSMLDMKWKIKECKKHYNIYGSVAGYWFERFFRPDRFALGRLQFEPSYAAHDYEKDGNVIRKGDIVINMHIPSCGPMTEELCMDSFRQAEQFFKDLFPGRPVAFMCNSWLLYPEHENMLEPTTNMRKFMNFFEIVEGREDPNGGNLWRIFYAHDYSDPTKLPQETSLQRAYVKLLSSGKPAGSGVGYFFMKDGVIL
jgi:hypothetical protein